MGVARPRLALLAWLRLPRRTARFRLTALYGGLFLLSGVALVATTYVLFQRATEYKTPQLPKIPHSPALQNLQRLPLARALPELYKDQNQLTQVRLQLGREVTVRALPGFPVHPLESAVSQLRADQHQLAQAVHRLAQAVHEVAQAGSVQAAQRAADSHQLLVDSGIALAIVAVLALTAGWLVAGRMLRPIRTITRKARRISSTSLHERLALDGPKDELKELADTLDGLFERLDAAFDAQRQFVANASHELRTPLARQRALIQVALADPQASFSSLRAAHERVLSSEQQLEQMIDALLALTRGQAGLERREPVDLEILAHQALHAREADAAGRDLDVRTALATAPTAGDPRLIERLIANLIDNAIRHNTPGGHIEIATGTRDRHAFVSITNSGPAVPPEEIQRLFQPFQRLGEARTGHDNGHGLGLSIVQAIAGAHDAQLNARARPQGGLTIEISFPQANGESSRATSAATSRQRPNHRAAPPISAKPG